jgi:hypothetical protein
MISEKLATLGTREKIMLALAGLTVLVVLVDRIAVHYVTEQFRSLEEDIRANEAELSAQRQILKRGGLIAREYVRIQKDVTEMPSAAVAMDRLKGEIDELAVESGVSILAIKHRENRRSSWGFCEECVIDIEKFEAGTKELMTFLHRVFSSRKLLKVERLSLVPQRDGTVFSGSMSIAKVVVVGAAAENPPPEAKPGVKKAAGE